MHSSRHEQRRQAHHSHAHSQSTPTITHKLAHSLTRSLAHSLTRSHDSNASGGSASTAAGGPTRGELARTAVCHDVPSHVSFDICASCEPPCLSALLPVLRFSWLRVRRRVEGQHCWCSGSNWLRGHVHYRVSSSICERRCFVCSPPRERELMSCTNHASPSIILLL